ncbi:hypothetical protein TL16_g07819, partial [Triparma laevis f. inornata]|uniref:Diphosphomevalonate decarboxylase n=2 Tax=Triparma laevis TaxID=1534972 RepID=A0A9W6Z6E9_9STRA
MSAPTNIACVKYWGKRSIALNTPINSSVSVTLDQADLKAVTTVTVSKTFKKDRLWLNGVEEDVTKSKRFIACVTGVKNLATEKLDSSGEVLVDKSEWKDYGVHVSSMNTFPTAAGLASSAAGYAALVACLAEVFGAIETYPGELSTIARQGSGSACRSLYGGFVAWRMGSDNDTGADSLAEQVFDENHWPKLKAIILVVSDEKKDTSSTEGMSTSVSTSKLLGYRAKEVVEGRMRGIEKAYGEKDFESFGMITMQDSNQFHATCLDTYPPIFYMNDISKSIIKLIHTYNKWKGKIAAAYTFDAGPNAVIYHLEEEGEELLALMLMYFPDDKFLGSLVGSEYVNNEEEWRKAKAWVLDEELLRMCDAKGRSRGVGGDVKKIYVTRSGPGPIVLSDEHSLLDKETGENCYTKPADGNGVALGVFGIGLIGFGLMALSGAGIGLIGNAGGGSKK